MKIITNVGFIIKEDKILLGMKKRGFGVNKWNGFGGKVNSNEEIIDSLIREFKEECNLDIRNPLYSGNINFNFENGTIIEMHIYKIKEFSGTPIETEEMIPKWFNISELPFNEMWEDDLHWLPKVIAGEFIKAKANFNIEDKMINIKFE